MCIVMCGFGFLKDSIDLQNFYGSMEFQLSLELSK
jgi:hypothetical protein